MNGLRSKFTQGIFSHDDVLPISPIVLPNRQNHPRFCSNDMDLDRADLSYHKGESSSQGVLRSCCSRRSNCDSNSSHHVKSCERNENHSSRSMKSVSSGHSCCNRDTIGSELILRNVKCRTCELDYNDTGCSQCFECKKAEEMVKLSEWYCPEGNCTSKSICGCVQERHVRGRSENRCEKGYRDVDNLLRHNSENYCGSERSDNSSRRRSRSYSNDIRAEEKCLSWCRKVDPNDVVDVREPTIINGNEKRNLDDLKLSVPPLCSDRLQPTRHRTKNAVLSILETGEVCIELIKKKGHSKEERVVDVCRISSDGLRVSIQAFQYIILFYTVMFFFICLYFGRILCEIS